MSTRIISLFIIASASVFYSCKRDQEHATRDKFEWLAQAPAGILPVQINKTGKTIIPNGRIITPPGRTFTVAPHPYGLTLSPDGNTVVTANSGISPLSITIIRNIYNEQPEIQQIPEGAETDEGILASVFMGLAIPPGNDIVYVGGGQTNKIFVFDLKTGNSLGSIDCSYKDQDVDYPRKNQDVDYTYKDQDSTHKDRMVDYTDGYIGDLVLSQDGKYIYAVDQINFRMIIVDAVNRKLTASIPVGRYPFGICLSPDEKKAYVANVGMYEYKVIPGIDPDNYLETALKFPPYAYLSDESINGINTDTLKVPGLGDPNVPESFSVWTVDLASKKVTSKVKTGILVGEKMEDFPAVGGASPNSLVATDKYVFVSNGNNDCISVIDTQKDTVVNNIFLVPDKRLGRLRGIIPFGLAISPDHKRLYVAESGINAIGVIDVESQEVIGHIPAGWFPSKLKVSRDGKKLFVANAKGYGSGPNGGSAFIMGPEGTYIGGLMKGSVSVIDIPSDRQLKKYTKQAIENNFRFIRSDSKELLVRKTNPVPLFPGYSNSPIKHIVFVSKENRTYDEVFGQVRNGNGDPALARYGLQVTFTNRDKTMKLENVDVMPNHLALARKFSISDNFYVDSDVSADGHRWLVCTYPNEWVESSVPSAYGGNQDFRMDSKSPGMPAFVGASGAIYPEDYNEAGSIWEHMERNNISFWNFGFGTMFNPHISDDPAFKNMGYMYVINYPVPAPIFDKTSRIYPTFNMAIPDQFRLDRFTKEFNEKWMSGTDTMPSVLTIIISNDHGAGERPEAGYPFRESYMADNDLALGRLVQFLSRTPYWKSMAIIVTEDDSQNGVDHIDAHRSILMVISPYAKKDYVSHDHYSFGSIFKTFWNILGIPYLNQYDATTTDLHDMFTETPDFSTYSLIHVDKRIFDPDLAYDPLDEEFDWSALGESPILDHPDYLKKDSEEQDVQRADEEESIRK